MRKRIDQFDAFSGQVLQLALPCQSLHKITELMLSSYTFFESHPPDIQREWKTYIDKVQESVFRGLLSIIRCSRSYYLTSYGSNLCHALQQQQPCFRYISSSTIVDVSRLGSCQIPRTWVSCCAVTFCFQQVDKSIKESLKKAP